MTNLDVQIVEKSYTYQNFRSYVTNALATDFSVLNISEDFLPYAEINETRLNRLDKTIKIEEHVADFITNLNEEYIWLLISESWCGDAAQSAPVINKMAELSDKIDLRVVFRDENLPLMDAFLTNGGRAIPKLIIAKKQDLKIVADWGPRPAGARQFIDDYKATHGQVDEDGKAGLQMWYTKDKGHQTADEIMQILTNL